MDKAKAYYEGKVKYIQEQLEKLSPTIQEKRNMVQVLTQLAQQKQKLMQQQQQQNSSV